MKVRNKNLFSAILLLGDLLILPFSFVAGHYLRYGNFVELSIKVPLSSLIWMTLGYIIVFYFFDLYDLKNEYLSLRSLTNLLTVLVIAAVCASFLNYVLFLFPIGRGIFVLANITLFLLIFLWRILFHKLVIFLFRPPRLIIIGAGKAGQETARLLESMSKSFEFVGFLDSQEEGKKEGFPEDRWTILDSQDQLEQVCKVHNIDQIIIAQSVEKNSRLGKLLLKARLEGLKVHDMVNFYLDNRERIPINYVSETWILNARGFDLSKKSISARLKRFIDILFSMLFLILTFPLLLVIAILIKLTSRGPVFYIQKRVGQNEMVFSLIKFRSMIHKAETDKAVWAKENDVRITRFGKILRKIHLDELPQLINILKGNMSLVGPRPERPDFEIELKQNIPYYALRHFLKPGLTGWAQVNYPYAASIEESKDKLEYDLYYVYHKTILFDFRIILRTLKNVFFEKTAGHLASFLHPNCKNF